MEHIFAERLDSVFNQLSRHIQVRMETTCQNGMAWAGPCLPCFGLQLHQTSKQLHKNKSRGSVCLLHPRGPTAQKSSPSLNQSCSKCPMHHSIRMIPSLWKACFVWRRNLSLCFLTGERLVIHLPDSPRQGKTTRAKIADHVAADAKLVPRSDTQPCCCQGQHEIHGYSHG